MQINLRTVERAIGVIAIVSGLTGTGWSIYNQHESQDQVACQSRINQEFQTVIKERAALDTENEANLNNFVVQLIQSPRYTKAQDQKVINDYLTELAKVNGELRNLTYPNFGSC